MEKSESIRRKAPERKQQAKKGQSSSTPLEGKDRHHRGSGLGQGRQVEIQKKLTEIGKPSRQERITGAERSHSFAGFYA